MEAVSQNKMKRNGKGSVIGRRKGGQGSGCRGERTCASDLFTLGG